MIRARDHSVFSSQSTLSAMQPRDRSTLRSMQQVPGAPRSIQAVFPRGISRAHTCHALCSMFNETLASTFIFSTVFSA